MTSKRWISQRYLRKQAEAEERWQADAKIIHAGEKQSMLSMLEERGYIDTIAGYDVSGPTSRREITDTT